MLKKTFAATALALLAVFAVAPAASAAPYTPGTPAATVSGGTTAGEPAAVAFAEGTFAAGEQVEFTVDGPGLATLSIVKAATATLTKTATGAGAVTVNVTIPANAPGTYTVLATGLTSGATASAVLTAVADGTLASTDGTLAATGVNMPMLLIWAAAGVLLLGVALVVVRTTVRRQGANA